METETGVPHKYERVVAGRRLASGLATGMVILALSAGGLDAQQPTGMRLGELYDEARQRSPGVAAARSLARAAQARIAEAKLPPDPQLQLGFMNRALPGLEPMPGIGMTQLSLMQMLPVAGQLRLKGSVARHRAAAAAERARETEWEIRTAVAMAFYDLYATDGQLTVARETLRLLHDISRTAESMYRVGEGRQTDVLRAQVEIARMTEDTLRMTAMRRSMAARLDALLDRPESHPGAPVLPVFPAALPDVETLQQEALDGRRMLRAGNAEVDAAADMRRLAKREIWPDLQVGIAYAQGPSLAGMDDPSRTERMGSLMLGASVPVFARGRQLAMREEAAAMEQMARADLTAMRADTRGRVAGAFADLERARRLQQLYRATVLPQASATVQSAFSSYRVGAVDFMTLLDNQMSVNEYRSELAVLEADEGKAWAELEMLTGRELFDPYSTAPAVAAGGDR
jgi:cobalt-zinc-cadmium efflux system outer membrane protein